MQLPTGHQVATAAAEIGAVVGTELALVALARGLQRHREGRTPGLLRRGLVALLGELVAMGASEMYWKRRVLRSAVDSRIAAERAALPRQRRPAAHGLHASH